MGIYGIIKLLSDCSNRGVYCIRDKCTDACINSLYMRFHVSSMFCVDTYP